MRKKKTYQLFLSCDHLLSIVWGRKLVQFRHAGAKG